MVGFSGLGSLPGADAGAALRMTFDKVPELPYLPELPARGPWAALIGRGLGMVANLEVDLVAGEWRLADTPGVDQRRARSTWRDDLDRLEEYAHGYSGEFKVAIAGPWTMAAALGARHSGRALADPGARRDIAGAIAEGVGDLLLDLGRRLPMARLVLQVDEPSLPMVAAGAVPTRGGFFRHRAVDLPELCRHLGWITAEPGRRGLTVSTVLHSCAAWHGPGAWPLRLLLGRDSQGAGFDAFSFDLQQLTLADVEALAEAADDGAGVYLGCLPTTGAPRPLPVDAVRVRVLQLLERLEVDRTMAGRIVLTPACGLAGWSSREAGRAFDVLARVAAQVNEYLGG